VEFSANSRGIPRPVTTTRDMARPLATAHKLIQDAIPIIGRRVAIVKWLALLERKTGLLNP
jgi:hypothetical protein